MRPGQQNKRGRGRSGSGGNNNNNRKGQNPLTRTYDSSGPDVKIRGSAQHVAEKYMNLARDAQSSGDRVMAENYLQHAEHYNRIIAAAQAQMQERAQREDRDNQRDEREERDERAVQGRSNQDDDDDETGDEVHETDSGSVNGNPAPNRPAASGSRGRPRRAERPAESPVSEPGSPQPVISGIPAEVALEGQASGEAGETRTPARRRSRPKRARAEEGSETASADSDAPVNEVAPAD